MYRCTYDPKCERVGICQADVRGESERCGRTKQEVPYVSYYQRTPKSAVPSLDGDEPMQPYGLD